MKVLIVLMALAHAPMAHAQQIIGTSLINEAETLLKRVGCLDARIPNDGVVGPVTRMAIRCYQTRIGFRPDGVLTWQLLQNLRGIPTRQIYIAPEDSEYADIDAIKLGQRLLQQRGYPITDIDGVIGDETRNAIVFFEIDHGLPRTGILTPNIMARLRVASFVARGPEAVTTISCFRDGRYERHFGTGLTQSAAKDKAYAEARKSGFSIADCRTE